MTTPKTNIAPNETVESPDHVALPSFSCSAGDNKCATRMMFTLWRRDHDTRWNLERGRRSPCVLGVGRPASSPVQHWRELRRHASLWASTATSDRGDIVTNLKSSINCLCRYYDHEHPDGARQLARYFLAAHAVADLQRRKSSFEYFVVEGNIALTVLVVIT